MSVQWTVVAGFLYLEIAVIILMLLPILSPRRWHQFFKSRLFDIVYRHVSVYFFVLLGVLCLFLFDAIREMKKYSHNATGVNLATELKDQVKMFRAQRNFYITGFSIFLVFVIRRLISMLIIQDELTSKSERIIKEAESTVRHAKNTVLANTLQSIETNNYNEVKDQLDTTLILLEEEQNRVKELQEESTSWRLKYEEAVNNAKGEGDQ